ncbi:uncharacterized protein LOC135817696 [Sycon ciliatum]|uniref:uncharacterized protein LOC135817696 n=1 Tax=Sycon ciliatum TaxID=27933 RepID=UPI0031F63A9E
MHRGGEFLNQRAQKLSSAVLAHASRPVSREYVCDLLALACHLLWLPGRAKEAVVHLDTAMKSLAANSYGGELEKSLRYAMARADVQFKADCRRREALKLQRHAASLPEFRTVRCIAADELNDHLHAWHEQAEPVLVKGLAWTMTSTKWSFQHIRDVAGHCSVELMKPSSQSALWAKLETSTTSLVRDFIDRLLTANALAGNGSDCPSTTQSPTCDEPAAKRSMPSKQAADDCDYLFDWSLPLNCPELAAEVSVPPGLADNWLSNLSEGTQYHNSWPSLFAAPSGLASGLHIDAFCSSFWMAVFEGTKRWTIFPRDEAAMLSPTYPFSLDAALPMDVTGWNDPMSSLATDYPALTMTHPWQVCVEAGDVLLVPWGCAHQVENVGTTLAISSNVVTRHNAKESISWLSLQRLEDPNADGIVRELTSRLKEASRVLVPG